MIYHTKVNQFGRFTRDIKKKMIIIGYWTYKIVTYWKKLQKAIIWFKGFLAANSNLWFYTYGN